MVRKIFKTGNSLVISLPKESLQQLGLTEGSTLNIAFDPKSQQIILEPVVTLVDDIDAELTQQLDQFIDQYRPALDALAK
ncbi:MAG: AbrB/MazE/SpoVT family DNA-binding domain-containing protein [Candidatus Promineifilaceae bacterium]